MKKITVILFTLISLTSFNNPIAFAEMKYTKFQQQDIFSGIWEYQSGNEMFIVELWRTTDGYKGHYKKIVVDTNGNQISVVYDSNKEVGDTGQNWSFAIGTGDITQDYRIGGTVYDNTVVNTPNAGGFIDGKITIQVLNPTCFNPTGNTCTLQAQWTVRKMPGLKHPDEPGFNIPTNIILTKQ